MSNRYSVNVLSVSSITQLQNDLRNYKAELQRKSEAYVTALIKIGVAETKKHVAEAGYTQLSNGLIDGANTSDVYPYYDVRTSNSVTKAKISLSGREAVFIEFGAGVYYNGSVGGSPHPKGTQLGMVIGMYGEKHGQYDVWAYYSPETDEKILTHGTKATMPMYNAVLAMYQAAPKLARSYFR